MNQNATASVDQLWRSVRREAETVLASDPLFGVSLSAAILDHSDLGSAVAHQIGERLGRLTAERGRFARVAREAHHGSPDLVEAASRSAKHAVHDPATRTSAAAPELLGYVALQAWRVELALASRPRRCRLIAAKPVVRLQVSIHPSASTERRHFDGNGHHQRIRHHRRRGDDLSKRHH